jgi:hypothetical protein
MSQFDKLLLGTLTTHPEISARAERKRPRQSRLGFPGRRFWGGVNLLNEIEKNLRRR